MGWAACGSDIWPVRVEVVSGRGVMVGSDGDRYRDALLAVTEPGTWETLPNMDARVRGIIREGIGEEGKEASG